MFESGLSSVLWTTISFALCGSFVATVVRLVNRKNPGPRLDQVAGIGFLIGAAFGAFFGVFQNLMK